MLPQLSRDAAAGHLDAVRETLSTAWRLTAVGTVLAAAAYLSLGTELTGVLFAGNSTSDARYIGLLTMAFGAGLPAFSAQYVALRGFYAFEDTRTPFLLQVAIAGCNVALALLAYAVLPLPAKMVGVAAAYSLTYWLGLALTVTVLGRRVGGLDGARVVRTYVRLAVAALPAALAAAGTAWLFGRLLGDGVTGSVAALVGGGGVLLGGYLLGTRLLHVDELSALAAAVRRRGSSGRPSRPT
jgi:putative peptidoglycan lipid II flippase